MGYNLYVLYLTLGARGWLYQDRAENQEISLSCFSFQRNSAIKMFKKVKSTKIIWQVAEIINHENDKDRVREKIYWFMS